MNRTINENIDRLKALIRMDTDTDKREEDPLGELISAVSEHLNHMKPEPGGPENKETLQSIYILAEAHDQRGKYNNAVKIIKKWAEYYRDDIGATLGSSRHSEKKADTGTPFIITKQKIWICLIYAYLLYRNENYGSALKYLDICEQAAEQILTKQKLGERLYGTRSRIAFQRAHILYELGKVDEAEIESDKALKLSLDRLENEKRRIKECYPKNSVKYKERIEGEEVHARQIYAKILSFCRAKRLRADGKLKECLQLQQIGRICLHDMNSFLSQRLLFDVEICITKRLLVGDSLAEKKKIFEEIENLLKEFKNTEIQYRRKLLIERATILIQLCQILKSSREQNDKKDLVKFSGEMYKSVEHLSKLANDRQWKWRVLLLQSRVKEVEKQFKIALTLAHDALMVIENTHHESGKIQAKLQIGRIFRFQKEYKRAINIFSEILKLCRENDSTYRLCHLSLAECFLQKSMLLKSEDEPYSRDLHQGLRHWITYERAGSENGNVIAKAKRLAAEFNLECIKDKENSFFLLERDAENSIDLDVWENTQNLRKWLYDQACINLEKRQKLLTNENLAKELGFSSPATMNNYFKNKKTKNQS